VRVVICGAGVIGACAAYFLARRGVRPIIVERAGVACAASGKSGGFLALDWCDRTPLEDLARRSSALHARLADELDDDWGYRRLTTYAGVGIRGGRAPANGHRLPWLSDGISISSRLGSPETTAQVHPGRFTAAMLHAAEANGAELRSGSVGGLLGIERGVIQGVQVGEEAIPADAVVIALGPWSMLASRWLPLPRVHGLKGHSLIFDTGTRIPPEALFLEYRDDTGYRCSPEVFPRADGTTYVCAISSESPVPLDPRDVAPDPGAIERLEAICAALSPVLAESDIIARQACFRPVTRDGLPLIGPVAGVERAFVATGHSVWGILNAPATGEALAELIVEGAARTVDLPAFAPGRLRPA
jgi:glycine/D-amino acid oxidase-like deaminating enzyme